MRSKLVSVQCGVCKGRIYPSRFFEVRNIVGETLRVPQYDFPFVTVELQDREQSVCHRCYQSQCYLHWHPSDLVRLHHSFGCVYKHRGRYRDSLAAFEKAASIERDPDLLVAMASVLLHLGSTNEALALVEEATVKNPRLDIGDRNLIRLLMDRGQHRAALQLLERHAHSGIPAEILMWKAECNLALGDVAVAYQQYRRARAFVGVEGARELDERWDTLQAQVVPPPKPPPLLTDPIPAEKPIRSRRPIGRDRARSLRLKPLLVRLLGPRRSRA